MANYTLEEKKQAIEKFIAANQGKFISLNRAAKHFDICSQSTFESWIKSIYGSTPGAFLISRGVIIDDDQGLRKMWNELFDTLKKRYSRKTPASSPSQLVEDNPDVAVDDLLTITVRLRNPDFSLEKIMENGIVADPLESDEAFKKEIDRFVDASNSKNLSIRSIVRKFPKPFYQLSDTYVTDNFKRIQDIYGMTPEEFFISRKILLSHKKAEPVCQKLFDSLVKNYAGKQGKPNVIVPGGFILDSKTYRFEDLMDFYLDEAELKGFEGEAAYAYVKQLFIDADLINGEKSKPASKPATVLQKSAPKAKETMPALASTGSNENGSGKKFDIYEAFDRADFSPIIKAAGTAAGIWPKGKKFKVNLNGNELAVTTYFSKSQEKADSIEWAYDAATELKDMKTREEIVAEIVKRDPNYRTDAVDFATPCFRNESPELTEKQLRVRSGFIAAVATLITDQKTIEAIAANAQKKKNGTLYKGRVQKIALSGICDGYNSVYAIVARNKTDTAISITFEEFTSKPGDLDEWKNDFISTYHAGLPVSEALRKIFG